MTWSRRRPNGALMDIEHWCCLRFDMDYADWENLTVLIIPPVSLWHPVPYYVHLPLPFWFVKKYNKENVYMCKNGIEWFHCCERSHICVNAWGNTRAMMTGWLDIRVECVVGCKRYCTVTENTIGMEGLLSTIHVCLSELLLLKYKCNEVVRLVLNGTCLLVVIIGWREACLMNVRVLVRTVVSMVSYVTWTIERICLTSVIVHTVGVAIN